MSDSTSGSLPMKVSSRTNSFEIENLLKTAEQVTGFCRSPVETRKSSPTGSVISNTSQALLTPSRQLSDAEKLRKVILELVDTERAYVKVRKPIRVNGGIWLVRGERWKEERNFCVIKSSNFVFLIYFFKQ